MHFKTTTLFILVTTLAAATPAFARGPWGGRGPCGAGGGPGPGPGAGPGAGPGPGGMGMGMGMGPGGGMLMHPEMFEQLAREIGVDDKTQKQISTLVYNANKEAIDLRAEVQRTHLELRQLLDEDQPDAKKVLKQVDVVGAAETKLRKNRIQLLLSVRELLTPEQRKKLSAALDARRPGMGMGMGFGPPNP